MDNRNNYVPTTISPVAEQTLKATYKSKTYTVVFPAPTDVNPAYWNPDAENCGLFGTSAGGGLTAATLLHLKDRGIALPAASAPLSPEADMSCSGFLFGALGLNDPILPPYGTYRSEILCR